MGGPVAAVRAGKLLMASIEEYKLIISKLQDGIKSLFVAENLLSLAQTLSKLNYQLEKEQQKAVDVIINTNTNSLLAIQSARIIITKLKNICKAAVRVLNRKKDEESLKIAIQVYLTSSTRVVPEIEKAMVKFTKVTGDSVRGKFIIYTCCVMLAVYTYENVVWLFTM